MRIFLLLFLAGLSACGWLPNHHLQYRQAESIDQMELPEGMVFIGEQALYPVPEDVPAPEYAHRKKERIPKPPQLVVPSRVAVEDEPVPEDPTNTRVVMARDGNGYPIIMMHSPFSWAWEYVGQALKKTDLKIDDRDRNSGTYYVKTPKKYAVDGREVQIKLSFTANGIQIVVLNEEGSSLLDKEPGQKIIQTLYDEL